MVTPNWGKQRKIKKSTTLDLESKSMKELRAFAKKKGLKAKDTSKEELIEEIREELGGK